MPNEVSDIGNAFAKTACRLLRDYTADLRTLKSEMIVLFDKFREASKSPEVEQTEYLRRRFFDEMHAFYDLSSSAYRKLVEKSSQWVEHGKLPNPSLELELQVRLAEFECALRNMQQFFNSNHL